MTGGPQASGASGEPPKALSGRSLGDFVVRERLGQGAHGVVYRAEQPLLGREAVIKVLQSVGTPSDATIGRFLREARLASRLDHPYAAHLYAFGAEPDGLIWIAMELVRGTPLDRLIRAQGPLPLGRFVPLLERIAEVVHTAHEQGIVHRDLKPANVMVVARAGRFLPKLLDFGIAKLIETPTSGEPHEAVAEPAPLPEMIEVDLGRSLSAPLTDSGLLGSPAYMAPEQWRDPTHSDARTDQYSLAALCYECLTGRLVFEAPSVHLLARAHARSPVPPLSAGASSALDEVLGRALAKRPEDRFDDVLAFAAAFRQAAGAVPGPQLPQLDEALRDAFVATSPQPLAEAILALEATRTTKATWDALWGVVKVTTRILGTMALACRSRAGPGAGCDAPEVLERLRTLRLSGLPDSQWMLLVRDIVRPFADKRDAYPIPELVELFFPQGESEGRSPFGSLTELGSIATTSQAGDPEEPSVELLGRALTETATLLRSVAFISEYRLAIVRGKELELWTGARRSPRLSLALASPNAEAGQALLVDAEGTPILNLWPFVKAAPPTPGAPEELFLFDGSGRRGARLVALPAGFEQSDDHLWSWLGDRVPGIHETQAASAGEERPPYRGLETFAPEDAELFFGREREIEAFVNRLRVATLLAVVGPSGAGKSSFVQAGVTPALPDTWRAITVRPGPSPWHALRTRLQREGIDIGDGKDPTLLVQKLRADARARGPLLLVIDQLEELFTLCPDLDARARYASALADCAGAPTEPLRIVFTLRDDFLVRADELPALRHRLALGLELLSTPAREDLLRILVVPAERRGYAFGDPDLPSAMVDAVADQAGALALLSFAAQRLWELRDRQFRQLSRKAYGALGGVGGALAKHAEETLAAMPAEEQRLVREAFRHLVTSEGTRAVLTRAEMMEVLGGGASAEAVLERLVAARLLIASEAADGDRIEVIHETLLQAWPRLVEWRREDAAGARLKDQLRAAARQWDERRRPRGLLWRDEALAEYRLWRRRYPGALTAVEEAFAQASLADAARGRRVRRFLVIGAFAALSAGLLVLYRANEQAATERARAVTNAQEAQSRLRDSLFEQGRRSLIAGDHLRALAYFDGAIRVGARGPALDFMVSRALRPLEAQLFVMRHDSKVWTARFSPDGRRIVSGGDDKTARIWDAETGQSRLILRGHGDTVVDARFDPEGRRVVTAGFDGEARIWDAETGVELRVLSGHGTLLSSAQFDPLGQSVVTTSFDGTAKRWDAASGQLLATFQGHEAPVLKAVFSPDGTRIATVTWNGEVRVWASRGGPSLTTLRHEDVAMSAAFSLDGRSLVTVSWDNSAKVWDVASGTLRLSFEGHIDDVDAVAISPSGDLVATASRDRTVKLWELETGKVRATLLGHSAYVNSVAFGPDGRTLLTASTDGTAKVWDRRGIMLSSLDGHASTVYAAAFSPDGRRVVTASFDGSVRLWEPERGRVVRLFGDDVGKAGYATLQLSPDGTFVATAGRDGVAQVFEAATGALICAFREHRGALRDLAISGDSTHVATAGDDKVVRLWRGRTCTLAQALSGHEAPIAAVKLNHQGTLLATSSEDGATRVWDLATGRFTLFATEPQTGPRIEFDPEDGRLLHFDDAGAQVTVWDLLARGQPAVLKGHTQAIVAAKFVPGRSELVTAGLDRVARLWDLRTGQEIRAFTGHAGRLLGAEIDPRGEILITFAEDLTPKLWDLRTGELLGDLEGHLGLVNTAAFTSDSLLVLTGSGDRSVGVWEVSGRRLIGRLEGHSGMPTRLIISPTGQVATWAPGDAPALWPLWRDSHNEELGRIVESRVPFRLEEGRLVAR